MNKVTYKALRPVCINNKHLDPDKTINLIPRAAQFLIADGTLEPVKSTTKPTKKEV